ncbi:MAG: peptidylprolyl isomerase [Clostridia bacterium]|nr:peptidylprolyl isomerase [Clostridia bacterium]
MGPQGQQYNNPQGREALLEQLINKKLFLADAQKNLYEYDPVFKAELQKIKEDLLANFAITKAVENVKVTDEEAKKFYDENKASILSGETVNASHILVDTEDKAKEILADINDGKISFADAAKKYSSCPSSQQGGSLGEFGRGQMVPEFDQAVFSMEVGQISGPVKTQFGYHLIKLESKNEAKEIAFEEVSEQIKAKLLNDKQRTAYTSKINQLKILFPVDKF